MNLLVDLLNSLDHLFFFFLSKSNLLLGFSSLHDIANNFLLKDGFLFRQLLQILSDSVQVLIKPPSNQFKRENVIIFVDIDLTVGVQVLDQHGCAQLVLSLQVLKMSVVDCFLVLIMAVRGDLFCELLYLFQCELALLRFRDFFDLLYEGN